MSRGRETHTKQESSLLLFKTHEEKLQHSKKYSAYLAHMQARLFLHLKTH